MDKNEIALQKHREWRGKIEMTTRAEISTQEELAIAYTPGVAAPCLEIAKDSELSYTYTRRGNLVAVITDGSAVLGLGDIGPEASMPVMEGKCALFKKFADIDAFPICVCSKNVEEIVQTVRCIAGSFGGINLEDISAPRCFEIEEKLKEVCDIPIFHDDQHGTAVVTLAALINALKIVKKDIENIRIVINGSGAAGIAIAKLLHQYGAKDIILCDRQGSIYQGRENLNYIKEQIAQITNNNTIMGSLENVIVNADVFIGVSAPNSLTAAMVKSMHKDAIIFAMANPIPEIMPDVALAAGAKVVGTGRSDFANQINNVLAFPAIFRGALDVRARDINDAMKIAAAEAIAAIIPQTELTASKIIPNAFHPLIRDKVAEAVKKAAISSKVARV